MVHPAFQLDDLPVRPKKPRERGLTSVLDAGLSIREVEDMLEVGEDLIDMVKLGWGTAAVTPQLEDKISAYDSAGIPVCPGGTFFERYYLQDAIDDYRQYLDELGITHVEVSDGTIHMSAEEKCHWIETLSQDLTVVSEVGNKSPEQHIPPYRWVESINRELEAGSWRVICEARASGRAGIFRASGEIRSGLVNEIVDDIDPTNLLFEAPNKSQQVWLIRRFGSNVNLGNIPSDEVIPLETLRLGLRGDTLESFYSTGDAPRPQRDADSTPSS